MTDKQIVAYIAGIIDGEAYIGIKKSTWGMRNRSDVTCPTYSERVQIRMKCRPILELIHSRFGGSLSDEPRVYESVSGYKTSAPLSIYRASDRVAASIIKAVRPFLIEKARQADAILSLRKNKESRASMRRGSPARRKLSPAVLAEREALYLAVRAVHKR